MTKKFVAGVRGNGQLWGKGEISQKEGDKILVNSRAGRSKNQRPTWERVSGTFEIHNTRQPIKDPSHQQMCITRLRPAISKRIDQSPPFFLENLLTTAISQLRKCCLGEKAYGHTRDHVIGQWASTWLIL